MPIVQTLLKVQLETRASLELRMEMSREKNKDISLHLNPDRNLSGAGGWGGSP